MSSGNKPNFDSEEFWKEQDYQTSARAWLLDIAQQLKSENLDLVGSDITDANFPHKDWMPSNITLKVWDAYSELPEEYAGAFDIVHLRTLYSTVIDNKVEPLLSNCLKMLKPGGYLQWEESDASTLACYTPNSSIKSDATRSLVKIQDATARMYSKMTPDWLHSLPATLEERGCKIVAKEDFEPEARLARAWTDNMLLVWRGVIPLIPEGVKMPMPPGEDLPKTLSRKGYSELFREAVKETGQGVRLGMKYHVTVAKKT